MSHLYDGVDDLDTFALPTTPASGPVNFVYGTVLIIARFVTAATWASLIEVEKSDGLVVGGIGRDSGGALYFADGNTLRRSSEAGTGTTFTIGTGDNWCLYAVTKPSGTVAASFHKIPLATGTRVSFTHGSTSVNATSLSNGKIMIAGNDDPANIRVKAAAVLPGVVLTTTQLDAIASAKTTASILSLAPADGWVVDDNDDLTNNLVASNTNRSARVGGATDGDNPAGWVSGTGSSTPAGSASTTSGFTSSATGRRKALRAAVTTTGAASSAATRRRAQRAATSTVGVTSTATGTGATFRSGAATTQVGFISQATGRRKALAHHDEASAVPPFTIPVVGALTVTGAQSVATGIKPTAVTHSGAASTTIAFSSTASGRRKALRTAVTTTGAASTAAWRRVSRGTATTTVGLTSVATGNDQPVETHQATAITTFGVMSTATGRRRALRAAVSSTGLASPVSTRRRSRGACATTVGLQSTAAGVNGAAPVRSGSCSTILALSSVATGRRVARGSCNTAFGVVSVTRGTRQVQVFATTSGRIGTVRHGRIGRVRKTGVVP